MKWRHPFFPTGFALDKFLVITYIKNRRPQTTNSAKPKDGFSFSNLQLRSEVERAILQ